MAGRKLKGPTLVLSKSNCVTAVAQLTTGQVENHPNWATAAAQLPKDYPDLLQRLKERINAAQLEAAMAVNQVRNRLYWDIGREILARQHAQGWGTKVTLRLSKDLTTAFPGTRGFSPRNLDYMRAFAEAYPDPAILQQLLQNCPWGHHTVLLDTLSTQEERLWYAGKAIENGWSRHILVYQIESGLHKRYGKAITNFARTLPVPQSELAQELTRGHYNFEFLGLKEEVVERDIEQGLITHFRNFFRELGMGFAFMGNQYRLEVGNTEIFLDLLFYNTKIHAYVVIEIKVKDFTAADAGQMGLYVAAVDRLMRDPAIDGPTIGIVLCRSKDDIVVDFTLSAISKPVGVGTYTHQAALPVNVAAQLPSTQELQREFAIAEEQLRSGKS